MGIIIWDSRDWDWQVDCTPRDWEPVVRRAGDCDRLRAPEEEDQLT